MRCILASAVRMYNFTYGVLEALVKTHTESPLMGSLGTPKVNVLSLNISLDKLK